MSRPSPQLLGLALLQGVINARRHRRGGGNVTPLRGFPNDSRKNRPISRRNFQYARINQFYTYRENLMTLTQMTFDL